MHLIHAELLDGLGVRGFTVRPGDLGENITTRDIDLLALPVGSRLSIGDAELIVTGLRNPCHQINRFRPGLLKEVLMKNADGPVRRLAGIMSIVATGGTVRPGDPVTVGLPPEPHHPLTTV